MNDLQKKLLNMMKDFHHFCEENEITYYIIGGTLLGAVRHKGFIPWDDDIDIIIPRKDYNKLEYLKNKLPKYLTIMTSGYTSESGTFAYQKLVNKETTLIENINDYRLMGIYIDIFPLDGAGQTPISSKFRYIYIKFLIYVLWFNGSTKNSSKFFKRLILKVCKLFDNRYIYKVISTSLSKKKWDKYKFSGNFMGAYGYTEILPSYYYGKPILYEFEDTKFYGPEYFDLFLKHIYGADYKKLPPVEKRFSHHEYDFVNLEESYEVFYIKNN